MKFDLENLNPGTWFDDGDGGRICLRSLSTEEATAISKKCTQEKVEYKHGQRFEYRTYNEEMAFDLTYDTVIVNWEGQFTADGKELECIKEHKLNLMRKSPRFCKKVKECLEKLAELDAVQKDEEVKN